MVLRPILSLNKPTFQFRAWNAFGFLLIKLCLDNLKNFLWLLRVPFERQYLVLACVSGCRSKHHHHTLYYILVLALFTSVNRTFTIPKRAFSQNGLVRIIQPNSAKLGVTWKHNFDRDLIFFFVALSNSRFKFVDGKMEKPELASKSCFNEKLTTCKSLSCRLQRVIHLVKMERLHW